MNENNSATIPRSIKLAGCLIFDIALILAFVKSFALFTLLVPIKSLLMLAVLLMGLMAINAVILLPKEGLMKRFGIAYTAAFIVVTILYAIISNIFSVILIKESAAWYMVWQLIILSIYLGILSILVAFTKHISRDIDKGKAEQLKNLMIKTKLADIESTILSKENREELKPVINAFKALKERMAASTPFGRIEDNPQVLEIEYKIDDNLTYLKSQMEENVDAVSILKIQKTIDETKRLVMNREAINIR